MHMHAHSECCDHPYYRDYHDYYARRYGRGIAALAGRVIIGLIFLLSAIYAIVEWDRTVADVAALQLPFPGFLVVVGIILQILGALSLLFGYKTRTGALLLIIFLVPVTLLFHSFWLVPQDQKILATQDFIRNLYYVGALLLLVAFGPGRFSLDAYLCCKHHCDKDRPYDEVEKDVHCCDKDHHCH